MPWWPDRSGGPPTMCEKTGPRSNHACRIRHAVGDNIHQVAVSHLHSVEGASWRSISQDHTSLEPRPAASELEGRSGGIVGGQKRRVGPRSAREGSKHRGDLRPGGVCPDRARDDEVKLLAEDRQIEVVVVREALLETSLFDEQMRRCEDFDLWLRLASSGVTMAYEPGVQTIHRLSNGLSSDRELMKQARRQGYQKVLATLPLTTAQSAIATSKIRELDKEIEIEAAKRHLSSGTYDEALAAIERARSLGPDLRLGFVESALRYCPALFRWCYEHYVQALHSRKRRHRMMSEPQRTGGLNPKTMTRRQVLDR